MRGRSHNRVIARPGRWNARLIEVSPPRVSGAFLAIAEGTDNFDKARNETGQG
jgi:hypothetical protein